MTAFRSRLASFAQPVALSEVVAVIQDVAGIVAADVDKLYRGLTPELRPRLPAERPYIDATVVLQAAELLTLDPGSTRRPSHHGQQAEGPASITTSAGSSPPVST